MALDGDLITWDRLVMAVKDWDTLRKVANTGYGDRVICIAMMQAVQQWNRREVTRPLQELDAGRTAHLLVHGSVFRLHIYVVRAYDPAKSADDQHLRSAIDFLRLRMTEESSAVRREHFASAIRLFDEAQADPRLVHLKHMRNKLMAHLAIYEPKGDGPPSYGDLFDFTLLTAQIWNELALGAGDATDELDNVAEEYRAGSVQFWSRWAEPPE
jgi:hypothetical protein